MTSFLVRLCYSGSIILPTEMGIESDPGFEMSRQLRCLWRLIRTCNTIVKKFRESMSSKRETLIFVLCFFLSWGYKKENGGRQNTMLWKRNVFLLNCFSEVAAVVTWKLRKTLQREAGPQTTTHYQIRTYSQSMQSTKERTMWNMSDVTFPISSLSPTKLLLNCNNGQLFVISNNIEYC